MAATDAPRARAPTTSLSDPHRVNLDSMASGFTFVDNAAHSNFGSAFWIKENWHPQEHDFAANLVDGFLAHHNNIALEIYGTQNVEFRRTFALDNGVAVLHDWTRENGPFFGNYSRVHFSESMFIGESTNHGGAVCANNQQPLTTSRVFPGVPTCYLRRGGLPNMLVQESDVIVNFEHTVFRDALPHTDDITVPGWGLDGNGYPGNNHLGALAHPTRALWVAIDRDLRDVSFVNTLFSAVYGSGPDSQVQVQDPAYGLGVVDHDGRLPCSEPGTQWLANMRDVATPLCRFRPAFNFFTCPPSAFAQGRPAFRNLQILNMAEWRTESRPLSLRWECNREVLPKSGNEPMFHVRTDKQYEVRWGNEQALPIGFVFAARRPQHFEGMDIVLRLPGRVRVESLWRRYLDPVNDPWIPTWTDASEHLQVQWQVREDAREAPPRGRPGVRRAGAALQP